MRDDLRKGREAYQSGAWAEAYRSLLLADQSAALAAEDLERLAVSAYLVDRDDDFLKAMDRAFHAHCKDNQPERAARCAFWSGLCLLFQGESGRASGWLVRAQRLVEGKDCVEQGYLLLPVAEKRLGQEEYEGAYAAAGDAAARGNRFGDQDLIAMARHLQGRAFIRQGRIDKGLELLDEAMVAVTAGELSPVVTGLIYCSVIAACHEIYAWSRCREWTSALARWCQRQPQMVAFTATCLVHRAEIMQLNGAWQDAVEEARRACLRPSQGTDASGKAAAYYQQAELHRLRGNLEAAEEAYREASQCGWDPQPGLALLRLAQGRIDIAEASICRVLDTTPAMLDRVRLLPAYVEIMLAADQAGKARSASRELEGIAEHFNTEVIGAMAAQAKGAVDLAEGRPRSAMTEFHRALKVWQEIQAPYAAARVRVLMGLACRALKDEDGSRMELEAAGEVFKGLGAARELARIVSLMQSPSPASAPFAHGLTRRELEVLRLVATGKTNKAIATELFVSEKTIDRHLSNIFNKINVPTRAAATAYAFQHRLV